MDKLKMQTENIVDENIDYIAERFPNAITEVTDNNGSVEKKIDFDILKQELSADVIDEGAERYTLAWPGKKQAIVTANERTNKTLRPCKEESLDFDETGNLYVEGDNLEVLKLLRETYLGKIKMIYIDPPYNTGNDFVYKDDFSKSNEEYLIETDQVNQEGYKMVQNTESNGRFHSDWLSMMYPRLKTAKDLLTDDGVIFISIDDNEFANLKGLCDEIFGIRSFIGMVTWKKKRKGSFLSKGIISLTEYCLVYCKNTSAFSGLFGGEASESESQPIIKRTNRISVLNIPPFAIKTKLTDGIYKSGKYGDDVNPITLLDDVVVKDGTIVNEFKIEAPFTWTQQKFDEQLSSGSKFVINTLNFQIRTYKVHGDTSFKGFSSYVNGVEIGGTNEDAYEELEKLFSQRKVFDYSKPTNYVKNFIRATTNFDKDAIILDFFSGSATTAQAVMQLNAEDGGHRRFIMVQIPEMATTEGAISFLDSINKPHYITEIGKERIRRAGNQIKKENPSVADSLDTGFRVLKLDSSNMKDVYYNPSAYTPDLFNSLEDNIKEDRTDEDLLFQVMLDLGIMLDSKIEEKTISGKKIYVVTDEDKKLICCFDKDITDDVVTEIAKSKPDYAVFRDSSMSSDSVAINFEQIFKTYSPSTTRKVL